MRLHWREISLDKQLDMPHYKLKQTFYLLYRMRWKTCYVTARNIEKDFQVNTKNIDKK